VATIRRETVLNASADAVWQSLWRPATLIAVSAPLLRFRPVDPPSLPEVWHPGEARVTLWLFGVIPLGRQVISVSSGENAEGAWVLRDNGRGALARRWDHRITITPAPGGRTAYRDEVTIEAGLLTPLVAAFAWVFYAHRQRRWHRLIASGALTRRIQDAPDRSGPGA
jgi:hypothetical protein